MTRGKSAPEQPKIYTLFSLLQKMLAQRAAGFTHFSQRNGGKFIAEWGQFVYNEKVYSVRRGAISRRPVRWYSRAETMRPGGGRAANHSINTAGWATARPGKARLSR
ncbi:hypothetical protein HMPREF0262_00309 [Clostridium sp. ATCC 29733]|nr:hypothetical protein HMPREF0262_00309 [Clostridium sp. ATCC 29733]